MLKNGTVLDGKYEILKRIGGGGTSEVYLAMNQKLNQQWVIKEIDSAKKNVAMERVLKEARMMMSFDHPAIPRIVDILEKPGITYIIMDYVSGQSLAYELKTNGPQPQAIVVEWAKQICNVLAYLHSLSPPIIYHDLKPGNIILKEPERNIKLIDFGEARPCINGNARGGGKTRQYAAPEQQSKCRGNTDARTDVYCLGTTMYRLLTGQFPPESPEPVGSIRAAFPELDISKGMDNIIKKCTQLDPAKRFQNANEVMQALENIELWDEDYLKRLKRKVNVVVATVGLSVAMLVSGIGFNRAEAYVNAKDYQNLINTDLSVAHDKKVEKYKTAIQIDSGNPAAYIKLLEAYQDNDLFGDAESDEFSLLFSENKSKFEETDEVLDLHYLAGRMYFNLYLGEDAAFRLRVNKAHSYFEYVAKKGSAGYENYSIASSYYTLCDFFSKYVLSTSSVQEPSEEVYREMLTALQTCMEDMQKYEAGDAAHTRLTLYGHILDMLNVNVKGFALNEIERTEVESILTGIKDSVNRESITQQKSTALQEEIIAKIDNVLDNVQREYESLERGR